MNAGRILCILSLFLLCFSPLAEAQKTKAQLQKEKEQNLEKIKETERILEQTSQQRKNSLGELTALNYRISQQESLVNAIRQEISLLDVDIKENTSLIQTLESDLDDLKEEYSRMLFSAQKASGRVDNLMFLFSSSSFYQFMMRLKYMEQYGTARTEQARVIKRIQAALSERIKQIEVVKQEKNTLLADELKEGDNLTALKQKQRGVITSLEKEEKRLREEYQRTTKAVAELDKLIDSIIKEEMARAAREARTSGTSVAASTVLSSSFEENRAKFSWPTSGFVSQKFGVQNHPVLKGIVMRNDDIKIQTQQGAKVKAIFNGEVRRISFTPGFGNTVLINHGDYYTAYTGLKDIYVKMGDRVTANQEIGQVSTNNDGVSELRFGIYKNTTALDPQAWLSH